MITKLDTSQYNKVFPLVTFQNDITVFAALENTIHNEVFVDNVNSPSSVLIKTPGTNFIAGDAGNRKFVDSVESQLDFWDPLTPASEGWLTIIPKCHPNKFIRKYTRCRYELAANSWNNPPFPVPPGFSIEKVDTANLRIQNYTNAGEVLGWADDYRNDNGFMQNGFGNYARTADTITNWSLSDGHFQSKVEIGVQSVEAFRKKGLSIAVVAATINQCFSKGFKGIQWLCVDSNKGSRAIAEKLGFSLKNTYSSFSSYPPCENVLDYSQHDWEDWATYYEMHSGTEPRLLGEQLVAFIKADNDIKAKETVLAILAQDTFYDNLEIAACVPGMIYYFQAIGMCPSLSGKEWTCFLQSYGCQRQ